INWPGVTCWVAIGLPLAAPCCRRWPWRPTFPRRRTFWCRSRMGAIVSSALRRTMKLMTLGIVALPLLGQGRPRFGGSPPTVPDEDFSKNNIAYDGRFTYARYRYTPIRVGWGRNSFFGADYYWDHDYPRADHHFPTIIGERTSINAHRTESNMFASTDT